MKDYKIINFDKTRGSIVIKYSEEFSPMGIDIPINDNKYIIGEELDTFIKGFIPVNYMNRLNLIKSGVSNAQEIQALVEEEPTKIASIDEEKIKLEKQYAVWEEEQFEQNIVTLLKKYKLLNEE
jgi:hypothetical protein